MREVDDVIYIESSKAPHIVSYEIPIGKPGNTRLDDNFIRWIPN